MPDPQAAYTINAGDVAAKVIDGELIIIRLSDGTYYSMDPVGTAVWQLLEDGHALVTVVETIARWYEKPADEVEGDVAPLVRELIAERLINEAPATATEVRAAPATLPAYQPPSLSIYRDMGNLLALDPPTPGIDDLLFRDSAAH